MEGTNFCHILENVTSTRGHNIRVNQAHRLPRVSLFAMSPRERAVGSPMPAAVELRRRPLYLGRGEREHLAQ